jgi:eukaryotic-like serine/threonine-protein kinase
MIGKTISHYRLLERLGSGGMGVVYKAQDLKLGRAVALKFLPEQIARTAEALERFQREAQAASALNHPAICTIYEIDEADGHVFISMELLEGESLKDRLARGRLSFDEVLEFGMQLADALHKAHQKGISHRDIKPANVFLTNDGRARLLDFGLATVESPDGHEGGGETVTSLTRPGMVMGTIGYMSPEQALGQIVDHRTDLFSFGLVLYEMATGHQAFPGSSTAAVFDAVLNRQPGPASTVHPDIPPAFDRIIERALEKDREERTQSAAEMRAELKRLRRDSTLGQHSGAMPTARTVRVPRQGRRRVPLWLAGGALALAVVLVLVSAGILWRARSGPGPSLADARFVQLTHQPGPELWPSLFPDGRSMVYASRASGNWDIYLQRVDGQRPMNLTPDSPDDDTEPAVSPNGDRIVFRSEREGGGLFVMGATGESVRRISDFGFNPAWSPDGAAIVCATEGVDIPTTRWSTSTLWIVDVATGARRQLTTSDAVQPHWSPNGHRIAYWLAGAGGQRNIWTIPAAGGDPVAVTDDAYLDWNPVWAPDGAHLFFSSNRGGSLNLWRVRIDERSGRVLAPPEPLRTPSANSGFLSLSADGMRIAYVHQTFARNISRFPFDPEARAPAGAPERVTHSTQVLRSPAISPDGRRVAYASDDQIFVADADGTNPRQLTQDAFTNRGPRWSPDGRTIAFYANRTGTFQIWTIRPDGSGLRQVTDQTGTEGFYYPVWSPDGQRMLFSSFEGRSMAVDVSKAWHDQAPTSLPPLDDPDTSFVAWSWSPDGARVAGWQLRPDGRSAGILLFEPGSGTYSRVTSLGSFPDWLDDRTLLFSDRNRLLLVEIGSDTLHRVPVPDGFADEFALSADAGWVYLAEDEREGDVWLISLSEERR